MYRPDNGTTNRHLLGLSAVFSYFCTAYVNPPVMNRTFRYYFWLIAVLAAVCLLPFLGLADFNTKGEPREAVMACDMIANNHWILPLYNNGDVAFKPPFFHWLIALFSLVGGAVNEYTSRLPSALALLLMTVGGYVFYARRRGAAVAFVAAIITLTNFETHRAGMNCRVDMVLTATMVGALYLLYRWTERGLRGLPWGAMLLMGAATLTKGPVGIVLPCLVTWVFVLVRGGRFWPTTARFTLTALGACLLPLAWYVAAYVDQGDRFLAMAYEENVLRFTGKMTYESHENPWTYNLMTLLAGYTPYTLLALIGLAALPWRRLRRQATRPWTRFKTWITGMDPVRLFSLLSIVIIFVFYCIPKSKRSVYLLPVYPFIAYFLAEWMFRLWRRRPWVLRAYGTTLAVLSLALLALFVVVRMGGVPDTVFSGRHAAENIDFLHALETVPLGVLGYILIFLQAAAAIDLLRSLCNRGLNRSRALVFLPLAVTVTLYLALDGFYQPTVLNVKSDRHVAEAIGRMQPDGTLYGYMQRGAGRFFNINFYTGDRVLVFEQEQPDSGLLIVGTADYRESLVPRFGDRYRFHPLLNSGHRSCDSKDTVCVYRFQRLPEEKNGQTRRPQHQTDGNRTAPATVDGQPD